MKSLKIVFILMVFLMSGWIRLPSLKESGAVISENHWAKSGLSFVDLQRYINSQSCHSRSKQTLACVVGIDSMARLIGMQVVVGNPSSSTENFQKVFRLEKQNTLENTLFNKYTQKEWARLIETSVVGLDVAAMVDSIMVRSTELNNVAQVSGSGINGYLSVINDPHTYVVPISLFNEAIGSQTHTEVSVGMVLKKVDNIIFVYRVLPRSSAFNMGIKKGDRVLSIDGQTLNGNTFESLKQKLKGDLGRHVNIVLAQENEVVPMELVQETIEVRSVESSRLEKSNGSFGVLTLSRFSAGSCMELRGQLIAQIEKGVSGIILDLRDNGGGQLAEAACIANLFLAKNKVIYYTKLLSNKSIEAVKTHDEPLYKGPLSIIVNSNSASASEILAGSLQDHKRALIVGERTFGKGSFQTGQVWRENTNLALFTTQGLYYLPSGRSAQRIGIMPDMKVASNEFVGYRESDLYFNALDPDRISVQDLSRVSTSRRLCDLKSNDLVGTNIADTSSDNILDNQMQGALMLIHCSEMYGREVSN